MTNKQMVTLDDFQVLVNEHRELFVMMWEVFNPNMTETDRQLFGQTLDKLMDGHDFFDAYGVAMDETLKYNMAQIRDLLRSGDRRIQQQLSMNIQYQWDLTAEEAQIAQELLTGQLEDGVWAQYQSSFKTALLQVIGYVMENREEQAAIQSGQGSEVA